MSKYGGADYNGVRAASANREVSSIKSGSAFQSLFSVPEPAVNVDLNKSNSPFICGTGSASRRLILENAAYSFDVVKADIDERAIGCRSSGALPQAQELVMLLGHKKADAIMEALQLDPKWSSCLQEHSVDAHQVLLTADQIVTCAGKVLEKPLNESEAREMLSMYSTNPCSTVGSLVMTDLRTGRRWERLDNATIYFSPLSDDCIHDMIEEGMCYHCAGALMIENPLMLPFIIRVEGSEESVMGLNTALLAELFEERRAYLESIASTPTIKDESSPAALSPPMGPMSCDPSSFHEIKCDTCGSYLGQGFTSNCRCGNCPHPPMVPLLTCPCQGQGIKAPGKNRVTP